MNHIDVLRPAARSRAWCKRNRNSKLRTYRQHGKARGIQSRRFGFSKFRFTPKQFAIVNSSERCNNAANLDVMQTLVSVSAGIEMKIPMLYSVLRRVSQPLGATERRYAYTEDRKDLA